VSIAAHKPNALVMFFQQTINSKNKTNLDKIKNQNTNEIQNQNGTKILKQVNDSTKQENHNSKIKTKMTRILNYDSRQPDFTTPSLATAPKTCYEFPQTHSLSP